jgi:hypothetical protein
MLTRQTPQDSYFDPAYPSRADEPDDTWDMPLPGERAALEALRFNWGTAYEIGVDDGQWWYRRRDGLGGRQTATTPEDLRNMIVTDYGAFPVPREHHTTTAETRCPPHPSHRPAPLSPARNTR